MPPHGDERSQSGQFEVGLGLVVLVRKGAHVRMQTLGHRRQPIRLDIGPESIVVELTGDTGKLRGFVDMMDTFGILEVAKSGDLAMNRGETM